MDRHKTHLLVNFPSEILDYALHTTRASCVISWVAPNACGERERERQTDRDKSFQAKPCPQPGDKSFSIMDVINTGKSTATVT